MTNDDSITTNLVGAHFRPPAKALLACLPAGHPLALRPEPQNEYDENAVQVLLLTASLQPLLSEEFFADEMAQQLAGQGSDLEQIGAEAEWHLGYLPKAAKGNKALEEWNFGVQRAIHEVCNNADFEDDTTSDPKATVACQLSFDASGKPVVIVPWPPTASSPADGIPADGCGGLPPAGELHATSENTADLEKD